MDLPLPKVVPDVGPGGPLVTSMRGMNALAESNLNNFMKALQNKYYGPNIESEIAQRKASTTGQNIFNQYAGEQYRLANALNQQKLEQLKLTNPEAYKQMLINNELANAKVRLMQNIAGGGNQNPFNPAPIGNLGGIAASGGQAPMPPGSPLNYSPIPSQQQNVLGGGVNPYTPIGQNALSNNPNIQPQQSLSPNVQLLPSQQERPADQQSTEIKSQSQFGSQTPQQPQPQSGITYPQAAMAMQMLGLGQPKVVDVDGTQTAITPWGPIPVAKGMTPYQSAQQKGLGTYAAKSYGDSIESAKALEKQDVALDTLIEASKSPEFRNVVGPVGSVLTNWLGKPGNKELLGTLRSASGEIMLQVAPSIKGSWSGKDQQMVNSVKANPDTDFPEVFFGKLKAQKLIGTVLKEREYLAAKYKFQGMPPHEAERKAAKETPLSKYKPIIDKLIHAPSSVPKGYVEMIDPNGGHHYIPKDKQELAKSPKYNLKAV